MKTDALLRDPVFQLNLLVWMAKDQPSSGYRVRPFFFENGFRLVYIEQPFAFPDATARAIDASGLQITKTPEPETILGRAADQKALYFEAKANSFGTNSSNSPQARGHLLACGPAFAETLKPLESALLCYVVPQDRCALMAECLSSLSTELRSATLAPGEHSVHGLGVNGTDLIYSWDQKFKQHGGVGLDSIAVLHELQDDTDPSPLLLVFTDEDCPNQERSGFYRRALGPLQAGWEFGPIANSAIAVCGFVKGLRSGLREAPDCERRENGERGGDATHTSSLPMLTMKYCARVVPTFFAL